MDYNELALKLHEEHQGKIEVISKVPVKTRDDLSTAYTPGVAEPCRKIAANKKDVYRYTSKGNLVAVVTDGTAVLGLGDIAHIIAAESVNGGEGVKHGAMVADNNKALITGQFFKAGLCETNTAKPVKFRNNKIHLSSGELINLFKGLFHINSCAHSKKHCKINKEGHNGQKDNKQKNFHNFSLMYKSSPFYHL